MSYLARAGILLAGLMTASLAQAECSVSADQGASERAVSPTVQGDAELIVSMTMVPKVTHLDYDAAAKRPSCDLGPLSPDDAGYELWGSDSAGRTRKAVPAGKGQPIAVVIPVFSMMKAIASANTGKSAPVEGYMLATVTKADLTAWRFYTAMPDLPVLRHDMAEALAGGGTPIFRNAANGKTEVFVPKR